MDSGGKKTAVAIHQEVTREITGFLNRVFAEQQQTGCLDLEAVEMALRSALHQAGAASLAKLLRFPVPPSDQRSIACPCGARAHYQELRTKSILTVLGPITVSRPYYLCPQCHQGQCPADVLLDVIQTEFSPGVRRMQSLVGHQAPFAQGQKQLQLLAGIKVTAKAVERVSEAIGADIAQRDQQEIQRAVQLELPAILGAAVPVLYVLMDGTGVPVVKQETVGRKGKAAGQPARTREVKLGCVFTQTNTDENGYAIRDLDSTTYVGAIETAEEFGRRLYVEAWKRGWDRAQTKVVLGDGAEWIWNLAEQHFPGAIQIVDLYHARQHMWTVARALYPLDLVAQRRWILRHQPKLDGGKISKLTGLLRSLLPTATSEAAEVLLQEAAYFEKNAQRMRYPDFRARHLFVGSGVVEAGCKTVIGARLKQSGMFWSVAGANAIIALRCCILNARFEDYWAARRSA